MVLIVVVTQPDNEALKHRHKDCEFNFYLKTYQAFQKFLHLHFLQPQRQRCNDE